MTSRLEIRPEKGRVLCLPAAACREQGLLTPAGPRCSPRGGGAGAPVWPTPGEEKGSGQVALAGVMFELGLQVPDSKPRVISPKPPLPYVSPNPDHTSWLHRERDGRSRKELRRREDGGEHHIQEQTLRVRVGSVLPSWASLHRCHHSVRLSSICGKENHPHFITCPDPQVNMLSLKK